MGLATSPTVEVIYLSNTMPSRRNIFNKEILQRKSRILKICTTTNRVGKSNLCFLEQLIRVGTTTVLQKHVINDAKKIVCLPNSLRFVLGLVVKQRFSIVALL